MDDDAQFAADLAEKRRDEAETFAEAERAQRMREALERIGADAGEKWVRDLARHALGEPR